MKNTLAILLFVFPILMGAACDQNTTAPSGGDQESITDNTETMTDTLLIKIGEKNFLQISSIIQQLRHSKQCCL